MPELRKDPIIGRWVIIAEERGKRPTDFLVDKNREDNNTENCPFCPGNEHLTPPEVLSYRPAKTKPNTPGWWIRVIPNKYPALQIEGEIKRRGLGIYDKMAGVGAHEVIIETPEHNSSIAELPAEQVQEIIWAYRDRSIDLRKDPRLKYVLIFKNRGHDAGATLSHPHSQLIALPIVPKRVQEELAGAKKFYDFKERCIYCDIIAQELSQGQRIVYENDRFLAILPFASRFPFETWILPKAHASFFDNVQKNEVKSLALSLKGTLKKLKEALGDPDYNFLIHTAPLDSGTLPYAHWHIELMPKLTHVAGFEWATGFYINPIPPEQAAQYLNRPNVKSHSQVSGKQT